MQLSDPLCQTRFARKVSKQLGTVLEEQVNMTNLALPSMTSALTWSAISGEFSSNVQGWAQSSCIRVRFVRASRQFTVASQGMPARIRAAAAAQARRKSCIFKDTLTHNYKTSVRVHSPRTCSQAQPESNCLFRTRKPQHVFWKLLLTCHHTFRCLEACPTNTSANESTLLYGRTAVKSGC